MGEGWQNDRLDAVLFATFDYGFAIGPMCEDLRVFAADAKSLGVPLWPGAALPRPPADE
jgi:hypothetical protein